MKARTSPRLPRSLAIAAILSTFAAPALLAQDTKAPATLAVNEGDHIVFVSQGWHCVRALWQADRAGLRSTAYPAAFGEGWRPVMSSLRDCFAKPKAVLDLCLGNPLTAPVPADQGNVPHR